MRLGLLDAAALSPGRRARGTDRAVHGSCVVRGADETGQDDANSVTSDILLHWS